MGIEIIMHRTAVLAEELFKNSSEDTDKRKYITIIKKFNGGEQRVEGGKEPYSIIKEEH